MFLCTKSISIYKYSRQDKKQLYFQIFASNFNRLLITSKTEIRTIFSNFL